MKKLMMAVMVAVAAFVATADEWGFTYQAELRDEKGVKPITGSQTVEIRLWETPTGGDTPLWGRSYNILADTNGLFNVALSDDTGSVVTEWTSKDMPKLASVLSSHQAGGVYVGLTVKDSAGEIVPRQRLYAVPFAGTANAARSLVGDTVTVAGALKLDDNTSFSKSGITLTDSSVSSMGSISATTVTASKKLTANGGVSTTDIELSGTLTQNGSDVLPVPIGGIILWNKTTPPDGDKWEGGKSTHWAICNGDNGTPDLKGRFVVGVGQVDGKTGTNYTLGEKDGGAEKVTLTTEQMPAHRHNYLADQILRLSAKSYHDNQPYESAMCDLNKAPDVSGSYDGDTYSSKYIQEFGTTSVGSKDAAHENRPPFYALYYIMRIL